MKTFNKAQRIALRAYDNGQHLVEDPSDLETCMDPLLQHIISELKDKECVEHPEEAIRRMETSIRQIQEVISALEDM